MSQEEQLKRIADSLEKVVKVYDDPQAFMEQVAQQTRDILAGTSIPLPVTPVEGVSQAPQIAAGPQVAAIEVRLSPEEREEIVQKAMADFSEQMSEFKGFIGQALSELPERTLKRIGDLMKKGEKFKLRRRHGCIYLDFGHGDDDFWLRI
ncbi:unnamed protein product [marine sediment metagenome]|uniref:Uncharacterized protein n=1 Tax=marine sediment metagenome TaxID=412755 RepID=X1RS12_9ZZZZ